MKRIPKGKYTKEFRGEAVKLVTIRPLFKNNDAPNRCGDAASELKPSYVSRSKNLADVLNSISSVNKCQMEQHLL